MAEELSSAEARGGNLALSVSPPKMTQEIDDQNKQGDDQDTASASSGEGRGALWEDEDELESIDMPLWQYSRVPPVAASSEITCRALAQFQVSASASDNNFADIWASQPQTVVALGTRDGKIQLVGGVTGQVWLTPQSIREHSDSSKPPEPIEFLSWDASGTVLAAMDRGGNCAIFELEFQPSTEIVSVVQTAAPADSTVTAMTESPTATTHAEDASQPSQSQNNTDNNNLFSSWMSALTGVPPEEEQQQQQERSPPPPPQQERVPTRVPTLATKILQVSRITYPTSFGRPSCMVIDPAYKTSKNKSLIVGWHDGRLVLTNKKEGLFGRRNDVVLFQSISPMEAVAWRGSIVAFADTTGIKLFDVIHLVRIAHIDRPAGARPTLYPTVSYLAPSIVFDSPNTVLVAWGDCLLCMTIHQRQSTASNGMSTPRNDDASSSAGAIPKRTVECTMAWELEGIALGVTPLDATHVLVFTLVPPLVQEGEQLDDDEEEEEDLTNDVQVQVVSRQTGNVVYCDSLPISRPDAPSVESEAGMAATVIQVDNASLFHLHSSFSMSRDDNSGRGTSSSLDASPFSPVPLTGSSTNQQQNVVDMHRQWNLHSVLYSNEDGSKTVSALDKEDDDSSVDSDDYGFVNRPADGDEIETMIEQQHQTKPSIPPVLWITTPQDCLLVQAATVDDAIAYALEFQKKPALALRRGLLHKRQLRRYSISNLVDEYLSAVLLLKSRSGTEKKKLSLRRMKLAIDAMPSLLGGHAELWERWIDRLEATIPGALFLLKDAIPVRDPILPSRIYEQMLVKMLAEIEKMQKNSITGEGDGRVQELLQHEAQQHFLNALISWGPTKVLKEFIKLYKFSRDQYPKPLSDEGQEKDRGVNNYMRMAKTAELGLQRRYLQTAAGYLHLPTSQSTPAETYDPTSATQATTHDTQDTLFDFESVFKRIAPFTSMVLLSSEKVVEDSDTSLSLGENSRASLETMARLRMMQGRYDLALTCYLAIGALYSPKSIAQLQVEALNVVHDDDAVDRTCTGPHLIDMCSFDFVLGLIESHHLHGNLLKERVRLLSNPSEDKAFMPLFALMRLVGLERFGDFLIEHCVAPESDFSAPAVDDDDGSSDGDEDEETAITEASTGRRETLPLDVIAELLKPTPAFLHWYLHLLMKRKPDLYVKFPNTANPPASVTSLHRLHFELYVEYANAKERDSAKSLSGTDIYKLESKATPLLTFLKVRCINSF